VLLKMMSPLAGLAMALRSVVLSRGHRKPWSVLCKSRMAEGSGTDPPTTTWADRKEGAVSRIATAHCMIDFVMFNFIFFPDSGFE
jgi:hypothetical protein